MDSSDIHLDSTRILISSSLHKGSISHIIKDDSFSNAMVLVLSKYNLVGHSYVDNYSLRSSSVRSNSSFNSDIYLDIGIYFYLICLCTLFLVVYTL